MAMKTAVVATMIACTLALGGCGGTEVKETTTVSKGQELTDLKQALDSGAINQKEYDRMRQQIIDRR